MTQPDLQQLTADYIQAVGEHRFDDMAEMFHPDLTFEFFGPSTDKEGLVVALKRLGTILDRNEIRRIFVDGDETCVIYDFVTDTPVGPVRSIEWLTFEGSLIRTIRLLFEQHRWPEVMAELERRVSVPS